MKTFYGLWVPILLFSFFITGCTTVNFAPPAGYSHAARKDTINLRFANWESNVTLTQSQKNILGPLQLAKLIQCKRFNILTGEKGELSGSETHDFDVYPSIEVSTDVASKYKGYGCIAKLVITTADKESGAYEEGITVSGYERMRHRVSWVRADAHTLGLNDWTMLVTRATKKAFDEMQAKIKEIYPICGTVTDMKNKGDKVVFAVDRGTNFGIKETDEFLIYYVDQNKSDIETFIALAKGKPAVDHSTVTVTNWNMDDLEVSNEIYPRIRRQDRSLLGKLFVVCRPQSAK